MGENHTLDGSRSRHMSKKHKERARVGSTNLSSSRICRQQSPVDIGPVSNIRAIAILGGRLKHLLDDRLRFFWLFEEQLDYSCQRLELDLV